MHKAVTVFLLMMFLGSCTTMNDLLNATGEFQIPSINNNVCKRLNGKVILYAVFVDSKGTIPWTAYDMNSTLDSMRIAMDWIEKRASQAGIPLKIQIEYHRNKKGVIPISRHLRGKTLSSILWSIGGVAAIDQWANQIGKTVLSSYPPDTTTVTETKIKPSDRERLIAKLRDMHGTDNVALVYFINNYYKDEVSLAMHISSDNNPEYAVVSFKNPAVIIHEFLHLFGALDLYVTPWDYGSKKAIKRKAFAMKEFPNEIMAFTHKGLDSLTIGPLTSYCIGWSRQLDDRYQRMITSKKIKLAKY